jgi:hypothetical protein
MTVFLISFLAFAVAVGLMSLGVLLGRRPIQGSCGGLRNIPGVDTNCTGACTGTCPRKGAKRPGKGREPTADSKRESTLSP